MERYICIHGHFYQPPRENPWLEAIELQDSAYPYHDWNEKITAECYAPNALSRILDDRGRIVQIINNYSKISFNFGPTLLTWLEKSARDVYNAILEADRESRNRFSGHGSALAQAYNHMILPLASPRDKITQVLWGIRDFEFRFGRKPEGLWLPETAVDLQSLDILSGQGILFTILAPGQAGRIRRIGSEKWHPVDGETIDITMPYKLQLPSGKDFNIFFYNGSISRAIAFEKLLSSGDSFAQRFTGAFSQEEGRPQIVHTATDGESYGHHHQFGDMALSYALHHIESNHLARLTNYGEYLERYPPTYEVEIIENSSWSCSHGVERWRGDCGCKTGAHPGWHQTWRGPLREALDWLRDTLSPPYEKMAGTIFKDPWEARNDSIQMLLNRSPMNVEAFFNLHASRELNASEKITGIKLLELQRHAMLMYTSCGWFFDDISGIETIQILQYAGRALQLAQELFTNDLEAPFLRLLERAKSNVPEEGDGRKIYERYVRSAMADLIKVAAHYAMCSLFKEYNGQTSIYCYKVDLQDKHYSEAGKASLFVGKARFTSEITTESALLDFCVLHMGDHNLNCGVGKHRGDDIYKNMFHDISHYFSIADFPEAIRSLDRHFGRSTYSLKSLFRDEQRKILNQILEVTLMDTEAVYRQVYENHAPLMRFLKDSHVPPPKSLGMAADLVLNASLRRALEDKDFDMEFIRSLLDEARIEGIPLDSATLEFTTRKTLHQLAAQFHEDPNDLSKLQKLENALGLLVFIPFQVNLWKTQNICYDILQNTYPKLEKKAAQGNEEAREWLRLFLSLGEKLSVRITD
ncbi:MAG: DUF3536 domain-containing protein [Pseudomonadota bacterium]